MYKIVSCVGGPTRSTILPCCVLAEHILHYSVHIVECIVLVRGVISTPPTPCLSEHNTGRVEAVKLYGHHSRYYCTYCISDAKKTKAESNKIYKLQQEQRYFRESDSSLQQGATLTASEPHTLTPLNLTHQHP